MAGVQAGSSYTCTGGNVIIRAGAVHGKICGGVGISDTDFNTKPLNALPDGNVHGKIAYYALDYQFDNSGQLDKPGYLVDVEDGPMLVCDAAQTMADCVANPIRTYSTCSLDTGSYNCSD